MTPRELISDTTNVVIKNIIIIEKQKQIEGYREEREKKKDKREKNTRECVMRKATIVYDVHRGRYPL